LQVQLKEDYTMNIRFLGVGGAFDYQFGNSAAIVTFKDENYLIDCGHSVYEELARQNLIGELDYVLITHLHADHVGSLSTLILHHHHFIQDKQLKIIYADTAFRDELKSYLSFSLQKPEKYIAFSSIEKHVGVGFVDTKSHHVEGMQTFGYYFLDAQKLIAYSGDLAEPEILFNSLEVLPAQERLVFHEMSYEPNKAHTLYSELNRFTSRYKIYGYHNNPIERPADCEIPLVYGSQYYIKGNA